MPIWPAPASRATNASVPTEDDAKLADAGLAIPVWDLPVRLFHWGIVGLIAFSWWSAEYDYLQWHVYSSYLVLFALLFRVAWGVVGSSTARFASFVRGPRSVMRHLRGSAEQTIGHTPLGALSVVALLGLMIVQLSAGLFLVSEDGDYAGPFARLLGDEANDLVYDVHHTLFQVLLGFIVLHIAAILFYRFKRGKNLLGPMLRGSSDQHSAGTAGLVAGKPKALIGCLIFAAAATGWIAAGVPPF